MMERALQWGKTHKGKRNRITAARRRWVKQATPLWLTTDHLAQIAAFYEEAAKRYGAWHVDHIVPLRGRLICGLHVPWNLQLLPGAENSRKGNQFTPSGGPYGSA